MTNKCAINFASPEDLSWISKLELANYGQDAWSYTQEEWLTQISFRDPRIWILKDGKLERNRGGGNVIWVFKKSYLQYSIQPNGGHYLTSFGGSLEDLELLFKEFFKLQETGRFYTHTKAEWFQGKAFLILDKLGFKNIGPGDNAREIGKWKMDLSQLTEFELIK